MLVPERIEPRHRARFDVRHREDVAKIVCAKERSVGDEPMDVEEPALPPRKLLQIEVELRLDGAEPYRTGLDPAADVRQQIGRVGEREGDAIALKIKPQPTPIAGKVSLTRRSRIIRMYRLPPRLGCNNV